MDSTRVAVYMFCGFICGGLLGLGALAFIPIDFSANIIAFWVIPVLVAVFGAFGGLMIARRGAIVSSSAPELAQRWSGKKVFAYVVIFGAIGWIIASFY